MKINTSPLDTFTRAYLHALAFTEDPHPPHGEYPEPDFRRAFGARVLADAVKDCARFQALAGDAIDDDPAHAGRDFWYTRNGHGCGFWDGDWPDAVGERLTDLAHGFGGYDVEFYRGKFR